MHCKSWNTLNIHSAAQLKTLCKFQKHEQNERFSPAAAAILKNNEKMLIQTQAWLNS